MLFKKIRDRSTKVKKWSIGWSIVWSIFFVIYLVYVVYIVFYSRQDYYMSGMNLRLFSSYIEAWHHMERDYWVSLIANIILFIPLGFFLPLIFGLFRKLWLVCSVGIILSLLIEIIQYVTKHGIFDIDDIFNNIIGTIIGYGLFSFCFLVSNTIKNIIRRRTAEMWHYEPFMIE